MKHNFEPSSKYSLGIPISKRSWTSLTSIKLCLKSSSLDQSRNDHFRKPGAIALPFSLQALECYNGPARVPS